MNSTAAAVIVIIIAALILAVMAGIAGYTLGRARAAEATKEADQRLYGVLIACKEDTTTVCSLLDFQVEQTERYRNIARRAIKVLPGDNSQRYPLERKLQEADNRLKNKLEEVKSLKG